MAVTCSQEARERWLQEGVAVHRLRRGIPEPTERTATGSAEISTGHAYDAHSRTHGFLCTPGCRKRAIWKQRSGVPEAGGRCEGERVMGREM